MQAEALSELIQLQQAERENMARGATENQAPGNDGQRGNAEEGLSLEGTESADALSTDQRQSMGPTARERLEQRIAGFFSGPVGENFSQFA